MNDTKLFPLFTDVWADLHHPEFHWVVLVTVLILAGAWVVSRVLYRRSAGMDVTSRSGWKSGWKGGWFTHGTEGAKRLAFPLTALVLVLILRHVLRKLGWEHVSFVDLAVPLLASFALISVLVYLLRCVFSRGGLLSSFEKFITIVVWGGLILHLTGLDVAAIDMLEQIKLNVGKLRVDLWVILHGAFTVAVMLLLALWIASLIEGRLMRKQDLDPNMREVLSRLTKAALTVIAVLYSLSVVGIDVTTLSVFGGALAVGLGFGLQKIASNYVSGFIILLDRSIRIGNFVSVDDKTTGTVTQITTRYTVLSTLTGTEVIIPNEHLVSNIVRNLSFTDSSVRVATHVQVAYGTDLEKAMQILVEVAKQHTRVLADPAPAALLTEFADSGVNLELGFWVADPEAGTGNVRSDINLAIWKVFQAEGIEIPFPQREVRVIGDPVIAGTNAG